MSNPASTKAEQAALAIVQHLEKAGFQVDEQQVQVDSDSAVTIKATLSP